VDAEPFEVAIDGVVLRGHRGGRGAPSLLIIWPRFFVQRERAIPAPARVGVQASIGTNRSLAEHFERRALQRGPTTATAALIPGALVETIAECGHFPWLEQPGEFRAAVERLRARTG
jgi:hypothetical protein